MWGLQLAEPEEECMQLRVHLLGFCEMEDRHDVCQRTHTRHLSCKHRPWWFKVLTSSTHMCHLPCSLFAHASTSRMSSSTYAWPPATDKRTAACANIHAPCFFHVSTL
eukprot:1161295-Pelagomonas_calceolata.AAC.21